MNLEGLLDNGIVMLLIGIFVGGLPLFGGKTIAQFLLDMLKKDPDPETKRLMEAEQLGAVEGRQSAEAAMCAEQVNAAMEAMKRVAPGDMSEKELFALVVQEPLAAAGRHGGIFDIIKNLIPGLSGMFSGILPIIIIGAVIFMTMSGGCGTGGCDLGCTTDSSPASTPVTAEVTGPTYTQVGVTDDGWPIHEQVGG